MNTWGEEIRSVDEVRNNILQKAISLYIGELGDLKLDESVFSFMAVKEKSTLCRDTWEQQYGSTVEQLQQYSVNTLPPRDIWITLRPGLEFKQMYDTDEGSNKKEDRVSKESLSYFFRSKGPNAAQTIDTFLQA